VFPGNRNTQNKQKWNKGAKNSRQGSFILNRQQ
jgi:hypothetical protein